MQKKDIMTILVVAIVSAALSFFLSNFFISSSDNRQQSVEVVEPIATDFERPPNEYFNENAINPTQIIRIGENPNQQPFGQQ